MTVLFLADPGCTSPEEAGSAKANLLSPTECQTAGRFLRESDRHEYIVAHSLVRLALSACFELPPGQWRFDRTRRGKPFVVLPSGFSALEFSLSHGHGLVAVLVATGAEVGVDVERLARANDLALIAPRICSSAELESLNRLSGAEWRAHFFRLWTLKEAYAKATGLGFARSWETVSFEIADSGDVIPHFAGDLSGDAQAWQFYLRRIGDSHQLAAALRRRGDAARDIAIERVIVGASGLKRAQSPSA